MFKRLQLLCVILFFLCFSLAGDAIGSTFKKLDAQGKELADNASEWAIIMDTSSGLYWEVKSADESIHAKTVTYTFSAANSEFVAALNAAKFGGFDDWRLPKTEELQSLVIKGQEPSIDTQYFLNTMPSRYISLRWCGGTSEWDPESVEFGKERSKGGKYARAVRGKPLE